MGLPVEEAEAPPACAASTAATATPAGAGDGSVFGLLGAGAVEESGRSAAASSEADAHEPLPDDPQALAAEMARMKPTDAGLDAMWAAMDLENRPRKPATERERRAAQRKAERAAAVQNILRTRAEAERAMAQFEAQNGPVASKQEDVF